MHEKQIPCHEVVTWASYQCRDQFFLVSPSSLELGTAKQQFGMPANKKRMIVFVLVIELWERTYSLGSVESINATLKCIT